MERIKILLVDDEEDFRMLIAVQIKEWGYDLVEVAGGQEALEVIKLQKPDIVILDYLMPEMDGIATLKEIRIIQPQLPVIMFTVHSDEKPLKEAVKLKVMAFIPKLSIYSDAHVSLKSAIDMIARQLPAR